METQVRTPQLIFMQPQRLIVPLFQRPYVWTRESQWAPLWDDVRRLAERLMTAPPHRITPHFLGAVVLQQAQRPTGSLQERTVIDGQQRLTTLQLLLDALHGECLAVGANAAAARLEGLVTNASAFCERPEDRFKVWPTNRDRAAFYEVMGAAPPVDHAALPHAGERLVQAHRFFAEQAREWLLEEGAAGAAARATAMDRAVRDLLQLVVIDLSAEENAQQIFETLNARGAQLTAADLIKNFVFQHIVEDGGDVDATYSSSWKELETAFWEQEVSAGRQLQSRASAFLHHWLIARTGEEIVAREVFSRFKRYATDDAGCSATALVQSIHRASKVYRAFVEAAEATTTPVDRVGLFAYRTSVLESEVVKPLVLALLDPDLPAVPSEQLRKALDVVESWLVRRMLVRATSKSYTQVFAEMVRRLRSGPREDAGDRLEAFLREQAVTSRYWPDDEEVERELLAMPVYTRLARGRLRMVLEAVEDHLRGWRGTAAGLGGQRVPRAAYAIEHVMPRKWHAHWPLGAGARDENERERLLHTLGNLTLLTQRLNATVSNGPWLRDGTELKVPGKRDALGEHDVLMLNRKLLDAAAGGWTEAAIRARTTSLIAVVRAVWPVPEGHRSTAPGTAPAAPRRVELLDLLAAGMLTPGLRLLPRGVRNAHRVVRVLADGTLDVDGVCYASPSAAACAMAGHSVSGWEYFRVDTPTKDRLLTLAAAYLERLGGDVEGADAASDDEDDDG